MVVKFAEHLEVIDADNNIRQIPVDSEGSFFDAVQYTYEPTGSFRRNQDGYYKSIDEMKQPIV